jgi:predicted DNA-binding WGR domain protein
MTRIELTNTTENHNKFWIGEMLDGGRRVRCTWGRIGSLGNEKEFRFDDTGGARRFLNQKCNEKLRKGYVERKAQGQPSPPRRNAVADVLATLPIADVRTRPAEKEDGRIYLFYTDNVMQSFHDRYDGTHALLGQLFRPLVPVVLAKIKKPTDLTVRWSQYAGCSCPCSPGFIVKGLDVDVYVDLASKESDKPPYTPDTSVARFLAFSHSRNRTQTARHFLLY